MENKINIAQLLKDCPKGMELDCTICNGVKFIELDRNPNFPIVVRANNGYEFTLTKYGQVHNIDESKCVIFPKGKTTWEEFQRPFKDGDIAVTDKGDIHLLRTEDSSYCAYRKRWNGLPKFDKTITTSVRVYRHATEEEKQKLFDAIKAHGYKWNPYTKTLEKFSKFKVGDRIRQKGETSTYTITDVNNAHYFCGKYVICDTCDNDWELVPNKFDITTLKPFESKVLVRDLEECAWHPAIWGCFGDTNQDMYPYIMEGGNGFEYCIPYEGNEHLLGTSDDCDEYYKTWE